MSERSDSEERSEHQEAFVSELERRRRQREKNERDRSFWASVGMVGTVGWTVATPTALGVLLGRWLDGRLESGYVFMVFFMLLGLGLGCVVAWRMVSERI